LFQLNDLAVFDDPMYLHEKGRPVIAIWGAFSRDFTRTASRIDQMIPFFDLKGMGMAHEKHDVESLIRLLEWIKDTTPQGAYIFAGSPSHWRTRDGDCDADPNFDRVWQKVDCVS